MKPQSINHTISFERLALLVRNRLFDDIPNILIASTAILALALLYLLVTPLAFMANPKDVSGWSGLIAIGGLLLASNAFAGMHSGKSGTDWILLPASSMEKYSAALLMYLLVYPILASMFAIFGSLILALASFWLRAHWLPIYNPLTEISIHSFLNYGTAIVILLAGSARFTKFVLGKVGAIVFAFVLFLSLLLVLGLLVATPEGRMMISHGLRGINLTVRHHVTEDKELLFRNLGYLFQAGSAGFAILYGAALVREKEARDEVQ
ncbi:MAG: hypothetical protein SNJ56_01550 [Termitinemataceae bacterium]